MFQQSQKIADTGFDPDMSADFGSSGIGPIMLGFFAFFIFAQGLIYIIKPEMTGRSIDAGKNKIRRVGFFILLGGALMLFAAFTWWVDQSASVDRVRRGS